MEHNVIRVILCHKVIEEPVLLNTEPAVRFSTKHCTGPPVRLPNNELAIIHCDLALLIFKDLDHQQLPSQLIDSYCYPNT